MDEDEVECLVAGLIWKVSQARQCSAVTATLIDPIALVGLHEGIHIARETNGRSGQKRAVPSAQQEGSTDRRVNTRAG